jgi:5-methyltetrahydropteroyltriglutamate--homocysteine methyltransferase
MAAPLPPYRADHVGSLLRPQSVLKARDDAAAGRITAEALRAIEDDAIRDVVKMQEDVGLQAATDGEFRRGSWHMDFIYQLGGVGKSDETLRIEMRNDTEEIAFETAALKIGKLGLSKTIFADDFTFLKNATNLTPKLTVPSSRLSTG